MNTRIWAACALVALSACKRSEDQAAKERIFSPEEPVGAAAEAQEKLEPRRLEDAQLAARVLHMKQAEVADRLGPHKAQTRVQFAWFRGPGLPDGGSDVSLSEETALEQGLKGDFSVHLQNDHNQGFQLDWVKGEAFVRSLFGPFRKRRTDRTDVQRIREQALAALPTFDRLARGLKLRLAGEATVEGRKVLRYQVAGFGARAAAETSRDAPKVQYPEPAGGGGKTLGPDGDTAHRLELWEKEEPVSVSGTLLVDEQTSAPLACDLVGHFKIAASSKAAPAAELDVHAVLVTQAIGKDPGLQTPKWEPDPAVPHAVKDPLRFLGQEPGAEPGAASTEEPSSDDTADEP